MYLRKLKIEDAPLMLSWMHDEDVVKDLQTNFMEKKLEDCESFIRDSEVTSGSIHLAIASEKDEYMGTVSLKHIDKISSSAEFAITVRREAMGKGYSWFGMKAIIEKAFNKVGLERVYWCVSKNNIRAIKFYNKHGFHELVNIPEKTQKRYKNSEHLTWYFVSKDDFTNFI